MQNEAIGYLGIALTILIPILFAIYKRPKSDFVATRLAFVDAELRKYSELNEYVIDWGLGSFFRKLPLLTIQSNASVKLSQKSEGRPELPLGDKYIVEKHVRFTRTKRIFLIDRSYFKTEAIKTVLAWIDTPIWDKWEEYEKLIDKDPPRNRNQIRILNNNSAEIRYYSYPLPRDIPLARLPPSDSIGRVTIELPSDQLSKLGKETLRNATEKGLVYIQINSIPGKRGDRPGELIINLK